MEGIHTYLRSNNANYTILLKAELGKLEETRSNDHEYASNKRTFKKQTFDHVVLPLSGFISNIWNDVGIRG
ncbi:MAG: hypothetical protein ACPGVN_04290 [Alphaproteobacteria bacterium]